MRLYIDEKFEKSTNIKDSIALNEFIESEIRRLSNQGFLLAKLDSLDSQDSSYSVYLNKGKLFEWIDLKRGNVEESYFQKAGFKTGYFQSKAIQPEQLRFLKSSILRLAENTGYPFASIQLTRLKAESENSFSGELLLEKGPLILIDTVIIRGLTKTNSNYIKNYLELKEKMPYNESLIASIPLKIKESPFLLLTKNTEVYFEENDANLYLFIEDKKANVIDGVIGILPSDAGEVNLSGDIKLQLLNSFRGGDKILVNWRKLQDRTQDFKLNAEQPFLINSPIGAGFNLFLYRRDTIFSSVKAELKTSYRLSGNNSFHLQIGRSSSSIISTAGFANASQLPDYADVSLNFYGIGFAIEKLDYRFNPSKGYKLDFKANTGQKIISKNPAINESLYDSLELRSTQFEISGDAQLFIPLFKRHTLLNRVQGAWLRNDQLFQNELFRIGGIQTLRGFDIESIFASFYTIYTLEYRFLLEQNSYLFAFGDFAYYENNSIDNQSLDRPIGFGAGLSFETKAGIFSLSYALGRQQNNPLLIRTAKVHFGLINYF